MNRLLSFFFALLILTSCTKQYKIEGVTSINRLDGKKLFVKALKEDGAWLDVDSAEIIHGRFSMAGKADTSAFVFLFMNGENVMPLVLENGKIKVSIAYDEAMASGTSMNDLLYKFIKDKNDLELQAEELSSREAKLMMDGVDPRAINEEIKKEEERILKASNLLVKQFVSDNYGTLLGPHVFMILCSSLPYPIITPQIEEILQDAPVLFKENPMVKDFLLKAEENRKIIEKLN